MTTLVQPSNTRCIRRGSSSTLLAVLLAASTAAVIVYFLVSRPSQPKDLPNPDGSVHSVSAESVPAWPQALRFGTVPTEGGSEIAQRFAPVAAHIERIIGRPVEIIVASDYAGIITAMTHGGLEFAYVGPKGYVVAADKCGAQALAVERNNLGEPGYHSTLLVRADSAIKSIQDARGATIAFVDPNSTSGYLVPLMHLKGDLNIDPASFFKEMKFAGSHAGTVNALKGGSVDIAATSDLDLQKIVQSGVMSPDSFRVLWTSDMIPGSVIMCRRTLPESLKAAILGAVTMFSADKSGMQRLGSGGFTFTTDEPYDIIRMLERLRQETLQEPAPGSTPAPAQIPGTPSQPAATHTP